MEEIWSKKTNIPFMTKQISYIIMNPLDCITLSLFYEWQA